MNKWVKGVNIVKIVKMHTTALSLPREGKGPMGSAVNPVIVELKTDEGLEGFGRRAVDDGT